MAATGAHSETSATQAKEVEQVKSDYGSDCRVITNIGDFSHVLDIKLKADLDLNVKFQLEESYPMSAAHIIVKSKSLQAEDINLLAVHLASFSERNKGKPLIRPVLKEAQRWLQDQPGLVLNDTTSYEKGSGKNTGKNKTSPKSRRKKKLEKQLEEETKDQKLSSMKTAMDVVSRILWDKSLNSEDFVIGYMDRMLGVIEKRFNLFSWEDVASVDYHTLAIPKHRIHYFKYKGTTVWDKNKRLDDVFGSTGGKTIDEIISKYKQENPDNQEEGVERQDRDDDDDDDDDDGITIDTGYQPAAEGAAGGAKVDEEDEEGDETNMEPGKDRYWGPKKRPTHFLCLRVTNPDVVAAIAKIHDVILNVEPRYGTCIIPPERIHVTLACLGLDTPDDVNKAADALASLKEELAENWQPQELTLNFNDIGEFFNSVLYAKVEASEKFMDFVEHLRTAIVCKGIEIRDVFDFTPHMTIVKLKRQVGREVLFTRYLDQRLYSILAGSKFGSQIVDNIHLCDMSEERRSDGFYITPKQISFP